GGAAAAGAAGTGRALPPRVPRLGRRGDARDQFRPPRLRHPLHPARPLPGRAPPLPVGRTPGVPLARSGRIVAPLAAVPRRGRGAAALLAAGVPAARPVAAPVRRRLPGGGPVARL